MPNHYDLIVIGGGVLGTAHAYHALLRGKRVLLLERAPRPAGATVQNFGQVVPSGQALDDWLDYGREGVACYKRISEDVDISFRQTGSYYIASTPGEMAVAEETAQMHALMGYPVDILSAADLRRRISNAHDGYNYGGLYYPEDGHVQPREMIHRLHDYLGSKYTIDLRYTHTAIDCYVESDTAYVIDNHDNKHAAERVMICAGSDVQTLYPELLAEADMQLVKLQMMRTAPQPQVQLPGNLLAGLTIRRYAAFKDAPSYTELEPLSPPQQALVDRGVHVLFKQDWDGSVILGDTHDYAPASTPDALDWQSDMQLNRDLIAEAQRILALDDWTLHSTWVGKYTQTRDGDLFQDTVEDRIHIATGIGGKGMTCSFGVAAETVAGWYD